MDLQATIEGILSNDEQWEWHEGNRYRIKRVENQVWYGLRLREKEGRVEAKPIIVEVGNRRVKEIIKNTPFLELTDAINQLESTKNNALVYSKSPPSPSNPVYLERA